MSGAHSINTALPQPLIPTVPARRLPCLTKFFYGIGAVAYGVRDVGFNSFLLIFYNQVLGLPAALAGLALMLTLVADAVVDPLIGMTSDGWCSRWGRRHPFLFAAAVPAAIAYYFLWNPPAALHGMGVFWYLLAAAVVVRFLISLFEVPFAALAAEFTADYDDRTAMVTYLYVFGWWAGLTLAVLSYAVFFHPTAGDPSGMLTRHGFALFGTVASLVLLVAMLIPALGTRSEIAHLAPPAPGQGAPRLALADLAHLFRNKSVVALLISAILLSSSQGFGNSLYNYIQLFFWRLTGPQISILSLAPFLSATAAFFLAPALAKGREKRNVAITVVAIAVIGQPFPMLMRLGGLFPAPGSPWLMPLLTLHSTLETFVWVVFSILSASMVADLVEENQRVTLRRSEGTLFAIRIFAQKAVSGVGVFLSGVALSWIGFPTNAAPGHVPQATLTAFALCYAPVTIVLGIASAVALLGYKITRARHSANLQAIEKVVSLTG